MSSCGCIPAVNRLDTLVRGKWDLQCLRGWHRSNEVRNVMYDCIKGQVREEDMILSAAALGIEVLSRFVLPCVPQSMNQGACAVTYRANLPLGKVGKMRDFLKLYGPE